MPKNDVRSIGVRACGMRTRRGVPVPDRLPLFVRVEFLPLRPSTREMPPFEFILVIHESRRRVIVDGRPVGFTNETIMVSRGPHKVMLDAPIDYTPAFRRRIVSGTTPAKPLFLMFEKRGSELRERPGPTGRPELHG